MCVIELGESGRCSLQGFQGQYKEERKWVVRRGVSGENGKEVKEGDMGS